jgi:hypothetical protein
MTTAEQRLAALETEVAELRRGAALREIFVEEVEARAYTRGRESVLGAGSSQSAKTRAARWLHAVPEPAADAEAELKAGA